MASVESGHPRSKLVPFLGHYGPRQTSHDRAEVRQRHRHHQGDTGDSFDDRRDRRDLSPIGPTAGRSRRLRSPPRTASTPNAGKNRRTPSCPGVCGMARKRQQEPPVEGEQAPRTGRWGFAECPGRSAAPPPRPSPTGEREGDIGERSRLRGLSQSPRFSGRGRGHVAHLRLCSRRARVGGNRRQVRQTPPDQTPRPSADQAQDRKTPPASRRPSRPRCCTREATLGAYHKPGPETWTGIGIVWPRVRLDFEGTARRPRPATTTSTG